jgi:hypothetical protein
MPRTGAEEKPEWRHVPPAVRAQVETQLGAPVVRATRIWGGYAPTPTFRLRLADNRRAFFKGTNAASNEMMRRALEQEERIYRSLGELIHPWAPASYGSFRCGDWHVLLLEDLGPADVPPWTRQKVRDAASGLAAFHASTLGRRLPRWLPRGAGSRWGAYWRELAAQPGGLDAVAALAGERAAEARAWLRDTVPLLVDVAGRLERVRGPHALLHLDARSDNMRLRGGRLRLFDWPFACPGAPELEIVLFAQSVAVEGGPDPERVLAWYAAEAPRQAVRERRLAACIAAVPGFFADRARLPPIPGLPRVRAFQRRQMCTTLRWAARHFALPDPRWLDAVAE